MHWFAVGLRLPERLTKRVGPPLSHPLDPRREYMEQNDWGPALFPKEAMPEATPTAKQPQPRAVPQPVKPSKLNPFKPPLVDILPAPKGFYFAVPKISKKKPKK
jgi:hypothetical protein